MYAVLRTIKDKWRARSRTVTFTASEWCELRRSVEADHQRAKEAIPSLEPLSIWSGPGGLKERADHSAKLRESILAKIPR